MGHWPQGMLMLAVIRLALGVTVMLSQLPKVGIHADRPPLTEITGTRLVKLNHDWRSIIVRANATGNAFITGRVSNPRHSGVSTLHCALDHSAPKKPE